MRTAWLVVEHETYDTWGIEPEAFQVRWHTRARGRRLGGAASRLGRDVEGGRAKQRPGHARWRPILASHRPHEAHRIDALVAARQGCITGGIHDPLLVGDELGRGRPGPSG